MHLYPGKVLHAGSSLFWDHDIFKPLLQPLLLSPADEKFLAHLTHPSKNWVAVIWLLVINHDQPFSIYCIPSCAGHSQFALQDGTQRDFRSAVQRCLVWKKNPNPNIPPCTFCEMFKGASLPPAQNTYKCNRELSEVNGHICKSVLHTEQRLHGSAWPAPREPIATSQEFSAIRLGLRGRCFPPQR